MSSNNYSPVFGLAVLLFLQSAFSVTVQDDFTQATNTNDWKPISYACLTAGTYGNNNAGNSKIPGCNYGSPDAPGSGALRLTPAAASTRGAVVSNYTFPSNKGLQATFTTYSYGGAAGGLANEGGDGLSFFLMDGSVGTVLPDGTPSGLPNIGAGGGGLGYSCSNQNASNDGLTGGYIGIGIDEFGDFLNGGSVNTGNTATAIPVQTVDVGNGANNFSSLPYKQANRIGLRGAGNISWWWLNANYPTLYPASLSSANRSLAVRNTCMTGKLWDYSLSTPAQTATAVMDYPVIPGGFRVLPAASLIANESASTRAQAKPMKYQLTITPAGKLSLNYSYNGGAYQSVLSNTDITALNGPLPDTLRFGFAGSTSASTNVHEVTCFAAQSTASSSSAGVNTTSGQVQTGNEVYLASYNANGSYGSLVANALVNVGGVLSVATAADWDASCVLTGGSCATMNKGGGAPVIAAQQPSVRKLMTWDGAIGIPLEFGNITWPQKADLNWLDAKGVNRLNWLRGDRAQELSKGGALRDRVSVLGDIVDSSPTWVGPPSFGYLSNFPDRLFGTTGPETSYPTFSSALATRQHVVYVGANDGFLHGFRAGNSTAASPPIYDATTNDGLEVIGFAPSSVLTNSKVASLTNPSYAHNYFVDAAPAFGDLYYNNKWHTWMVGGMGPGGAEIYALDITDPTGVAPGYTGATFSEANASGIVIGDWTPAALNVATCVNAAINCGDNLGNTYGTPLIRRLHNGQWAVIFGNGFGSANNRAGIYIGLVDASTGALSFYWLDTGSGSAANPNGIAYPASADLDGDHIADFIYAGDLLGNVWRFDLTSSNPADWAVSKYGQASATPLFIAKTSGGVVQPITTKIAVTSTYSGQAQRVILGVGTGQAVPFTAVQNTTYAVGTQSVYGLWDWDMNAWNNGRITASSVAIPPSAAKHASLTLAQSPASGTYVRANLTPSLLAAQTGGVRTMQKSVVCWSNTATCGAGNNQFGWLFDLPGYAEQVVYNPIFSGGELFVNTVIPPPASAGQCIPASPTGWSMGFSMDSGGGAAQNVFPDSTGSFILVGSSPSITGIQQNAVGTPYVVTVGSQPYTVNQTVGGTPAVTKINAHGDVRVKQVSWEHLR